MFVIFIIRIRFVFCLFVWSLVLFLSRFFFFSFFSFRRTAFAVAATITSLLMDLVRGFVRVETDRNLNVSAYVIKYEINYQLAWTAWHFVCSLWFILSSQIVSNWWYSSVVATVAHRLRNRRHINLLLFDRTNIQAYFDHLLCLETLISTGMIDRQTGRIGKYLVDFEMTFHGLRLGHVPSAFILHVRHGIVDHKQ